MARQIQSIQSQDEKKRGASELSEVLAGKIRRQIDQGELTYGDRLPSLRDFANENGVSFRVARSAFESLERSGIVRCIQGNGTYVSEHHAVRRASEVTREVHLVLQKTPYVTSTLTPLIIAELQEQGYMTTVVIDHEKGDKEGEAIRRLKEVWTNTPPSAIVLEGGSERIDHLIRRCAHPATRIIATFRNSTDIHRGWHSVQPDLQGAYYLAGKYLIGQGHKRIGLVTKRQTIDPSNKNTYAREWESNATAFAGTGEAIEEAGLEDVISTFTPEKSRYPEDTSELTERERGIVESAMKWLQEDNHVTAIVGQEPWIWHVKLAARWLKLRIPDDLAVIGIGQANAAYRGEYHCVDWCCRKISNEIVKIILADDNELGGVCHHVVVPPKWVDTKIWVQSKVG